MFCPSCGAGNSTTQRFCRNCGMNLERTAEHLLEQFPAGERPDLDRSERRLEKFGQFALGGFLIVIFLAGLATVYAVISKLIFTGKDPLVGIFFLVFLIFALLSLSYVIFRENLKDKRRKAAAHSVSNELETPAAVTGRLIEERPFEPVPSVTEHTTELLPTEKRRRS